MYDRSWTVYLPANSGPQVVPITDLSLPGGVTELMLEAWSGGQTAPEPNLFVLDGDMSLPVAQSRLTDAAHRTDALLVIPDGATARVRMPSDMSSRLTVFQDATDPSPQAVTIRLYQTA